MIVYKITNLINNKLYIGQTKRPLEVRWKSHISESKHQARYICRAIRKYEPVNFKIEILNNCLNQTDMDKWEQYWILELDTMNPNNGYNLRAGGNLTTFSETTKQKMSLKKKGKKINHLIGYKHSNNPETMAKLRKCHIGQKAWNKGIPQSEKQKKEHSKRMKGRIPGNKGKFIECPLIRINILTNEIVNFPNKQLAAESIGVAKTRINQALKGIYPVINKTYKFELVKDIKNV